MLLWFRQLLLRARQLPERRKALFRPTCLLVWGEEFVGELVLLAGVGVGDVPGEVAPGIGGGVEDVVVGEVEGDGFAVGEVEGFPEDF